MNTQSIVAKSMQERLDKFETALTANGLTLEYLAQRLKTIIENSSSYNTALSAITMLLKQQQVLVDRSEVTVTDGLSDAHDALVAQRASRESKEVAELSDVIDSVGTGE